MRCLDAPYKLLWIYVYHDCNHAGIWEVEIDVANIRLKIETKIEDAVNIFKEKIVIIDNNSKWFIPSFIDFQYGILNPENRAHNSVINILKQHSLISKQGAIKGLRSSLQGAMDKDKVKDMDKDKDKDSGFSDFWDKYNKKIDRVKTERKWDSLTVEDRIEIMNVLGVYLKATPEVKYRKNPTTFLNNRSWEDVEGFKQQTVENGKPKEKKEPTVKMEGSWVKDMQDKNRRT